MARGSGAIVALLALVLLGVVAVFTLATVLLGVSPTHPITIAFNILLQTINGNGDLSESTFAADVIVLSVTVVGLLIFGAFIGSIVTGMDARLERLRQGRSDVLERDHTLILGWSQRIFVILSELAIANESRRRPSVVILAERPKPEMEDAIRERVVDMRNTRVICRTGNHVKGSDLELVNHRHARSVILLGADGDEDPDADVIKTLLALTRDGAEDGARRHVVAEVEDPATAHAARLIGDEAIVLINKPKTVSRLIVQTSRQSGAAAVYREMLDFAGSEIYMRRDERLTGLTYLQASLAYAACAVIGLMHRDGDIDLNPPGDTVLEADDTIIALAEDDSVLDVAAVQPTATDPDAIAIMPAAPPVPEATLILGYNRRTPLVIAELAEYAEPGSQAVLVADVAIDPARLPLPGDDGALAFEYREGDTTERGVLDALDVPGYDRVILMSYSDDLTIKRASARSLLTLLHLRDIADRSTAGFAIVSEIVDREDTDLVKDAGVNDIVVSDDILSLMLTQVAENRHLAGVFQQLFQADGSEVYLRPVELYVKPEPVSFATLTEAASRRAETAIGYWPAAVEDRGDGMFGIVVNPAKAQVFAAAPGDRLIVLAEE
jgi:voltage-gated potassium channel Kch